VVIWTKYVHTGLQTTNEVPSDSHIQSTSSREDIPTSHTDIQYSSSSDALNSYDDDINLLDVLKQFKNFIKGINLKNILRVFKNTANKLKSAKGIMAKIDIGVNAFEELVSALNYE